MPIDFGGFPSLDAGPKIVSPIACTAEPMVSPTGSSLVTTSSSSQEASARLLTVIIFPDLAGSLATFLVESWLIPLGKGGV